jgi:flagellar biosynthesis/type III secretory pathway protein FliH
VAHACSGPAWITEWTLSHKNQKEEGRRKKKERGERRGGKEGEQEGKDEGRRRKMILERNLNLHKGRSLETVKVIKKTFSTF